MPAADDAIDRQAQWIKMVTAGIRMSNELTFVKANTFETVKLTPVELQTMLKKLIERAENVEKLPYEPYRSFVHSLNLSDKTSSDAGGASRL